MRLDIYIHKKLDITRNKAQFVIKGGNVLVNGKKILKSGFNIEEYDNIEILENDESKYVARSAIKLKSLMIDENIIFKDKVCFDVGSSTGGFCQIMLENNAKFVYALDVGTSQLHPKIREYKNIESIENTDIRIYDKKLLKHQLDFITCDVSFISLEMIIDSILNLKNNNTKIILLFKPQYEVGREFINKKGVPTNQKIIDEKLDNFCLLLKEKGVKINKIILSKLTGENGNKEYFILI